MTALLPLWRAIQPRAPLLVALAVALVAAVAAIRRDAARDALRRAETARSEAAQAQRTRERTADAARHLELQRGALRDRARQEQLDAATRSLPDAPPSAHARARLCLEPGLRDHPACRGADTSARSVREGAASDAGG